MYRSGVYIGVWGVRGCDGVARVIVDDYCWFFFVLFVARQMIFIFLN